MKISEIMTTEFEMIDAKRSFYEAAEKMKSRNVGFLPVREGKKLVGLITDRDIVIRGLAARKDPRSARVKDILTSDIFQCFEDDNVEDAARVMEDNQVRRLVVVNRDHDPVGIVSLGDIAVKMGRDQLSGQILERVSEPVGSAR